MRVFQINGSAAGSTATLMFDIADVAINNGYIVECSAPITISNRHNEIKREYYKIGCYYLRKLNVLLSRITGLEGCFSYLETICLIKRIKKFAPDIIHLHNIHGSYICIPWIFGYIKKHKIPVVWTLHDCWAFTGHCVHFENNNCFQWKYGCTTCNQYHTYPQSVFDNAEIMWKLKKKWFSEVCNLTIVTPSQWLEEIAKQSFLGYAKTAVINNGIDLHKFRPIYSGIRGKYGIKRDAFVVLGVAFGWSNSKGLDVFNEVSKRLSDENIQIVLVGTNKNIDRILSKNIISIHRTSNREELVKIYTESNLFLNPTRADNYPTVNMEAIACGTPVVSFRTGGSPEIISDDTGIIVERNDVNGIVENIKKIYKERTFNRTRCFERAKAFDKNIRIAEYLNLYSRIVACKDKQNDVL